MIVLLVAVGAAIGAPARYLIDRAVQRRTARTSDAAAFPWGTLTVNLAASLLLGVLAGAMTSPRVQALAGIGFAGTLSTFSTFSYQTLRLNRVTPSLAVINVLLSVVAGLAALALGWRIGTIV